jgi:hypothetical protein
LRYAEANLLAFHIAIISRIVEAHASSITVENRAIGSAILLP